MDLGWSARQFEESGKGFSYRLDEPLDMNLSSSRAVVNAKDILNNWDQKVLSTIIRGYGEERFAGRIANKIVEARKNAPIETTSQLVSIIKEATPSRYHFGPTHPARRTFQALRIAVNDEIEALRDGLKNSFNVLSKSGRVAVISFHSLEDRIVKNFFRDLEKNKKGVRINKKPITASTTELKENPRSRSAKLRVFQKND